MILNGVIALILRFFTEFHYSVGQVCHSGWRWTYDVRKILSPSSSLQRLAITNRPCRAAQSLCDSWATRTTSYHTQPQQQRQSTTGVSREYIVSKITHNVSRGTFIHRLISHADRSAGTRRTCSERNPTAACPMPSGKSFELAANMYSCIIVSTVGWTWWDWSLILRTYLPSVLWHCWLGHLTRKTPSPIWPIMCLVGR